MTRALAVANQKGGVAKTTTVISLGAAFVEQGLRVLLVDLDAQACLTYSLGVEPEDVECGVHEVITGVATAAQTLVSIAGIDLIPATIDLALTDAALADLPDRERTLRRALAPLMPGYDVVILDCSPSLGLLTLNALAAADEVLIPVQCEMLSHRGVGQLLDTVADVQRFVHPALMVRGLLPTLFDARTAHQRAVLADLTARYPVPVLEPVPRSVRFAEAPAMGRSILRTASSSAGARAYRAVAAGLMKAWHLSPGIRPTRRPATRIRRVS